MQLLDSHLLFKLLSALKDKLLFSEDTAKNNVSVYSWEPSPNKEVMMCLVSSQVLLKSVNH